MRDTKYGIRVYMQPAFLICTAVLAMAGSGMAIAIKSFGVYLKKEPLPLKKPLDRLGEPQLGGIGIAHYKVVLEQKIENEEIIKSLGTEDYVQWILEDYEEPVNSAVRKCLLFITYYDLPDRVPHVPEECYTGVGYQRLASDSMTFKINKDGSKQNIPGRHLVFGNQNLNYWGRDTKFSAFYLLRVNGVYADSRENARIVLNRNIFGKYSYFSKVEWNFFTGSGAKTYLNKEEAIAASEKLLGVNLPILEREHWPDWGNRR